MVKANKLHLSKMEIAEICADAEHFVGTAGGGMDHAAILLGENESFLKIEFNPLKAEPISSPHDIELVLFHSLLEAEKSSYVRNAYNRRVLECNFSMEIFNMYVAEKRSISMDRLDYIGDINTEKLGLDHQQLDEFINAFLDSLSQMYSLEKLLALFEVSKNELTDRYQHILRGASLDNNGEGYNLKKRFKHVYSECQRVNQAVECLKSNNKTELGRLLDKSHNSLSGDYEVSTPEVDSIVRLLKSSGAYGARMVGAGFGGMILALTDKASADDLIDKMQKTFYSDKSIKDSLEYIIRCNPADGAGFIQI
jgi:N-acetylgalactosamine kinase